MILHWATNGFSKWLLPAKIQLDLLFSLCFLSSEEGNSTRKWSILSHFLCISTFYYLITKSQKAWFFFFFRELYWQWHRRDIRSHFFFLFCETDTHQVTSRPDVWEGTIGMINKIGRWQWRAHKDPTSSTKWISFLRSLWLPLHRLESCVYLLSLYRRPETRIVVMTTNGSWCTVMFLEESLYYIHSPEPWIENLKKTKLEWMKFNNNRRFLHFHHLSWVHQFASHTN